MSNQKSLIEITSIDLASMLSQGDPFSDREHLEILNEKLDQEFQDEMREEIREEEQND